MLGWLRRRLRSWLIEDDAPRDLPIGPTPVDLTIAARVPQRGGGMQTVTLRADGIVGLRLQCRSDDDSTLVRLVGPEECVDQGRFWRLWRQLGGARLGYRLEDGTPFEPPV